MGALAFDFGPSGLNGIASSIDLFFQEATTYIPQGTKIREMCSSKRSGLVDYHRNVHSDVWSFLSLPRRLSVIILSINGPFVSFRPTGMSQNPSFSKMN